MAPNGTIGQVMVENKHRRRLVKIPTAPSLGLLILLLAASAVDCELLFSVFRLRLSPWPGEESSSSSDDSPDSWEDPTASLSSSLLIWMLLDEE